MRDLFLPKTVEKVTAWDVLHFTWFSKPPPKFKSALVPIRFVIVHNVLPVNSERSKVIETDVLLTGTLVIALFDNELTLIYDPSFDIILEILHVYCHTVTDFRGVPNFARRSNGAYLCPYNYHHSSERSVSNCYRYVQRELRTRSTSRLPWNPKLSHD